MRKLISSFPHSALFSLTTSSIVLQLTFLLARPLNLACAANFIHVHLGGPTVCCLLNVDVGTTELPGMNAATQHAGAGSSQ